MQPGHAMAIAPVSSRLPLVAHIIYRLDIGGLENGLVNLINSMPSERYRHAIICLAGYTDFADRIKREDTLVFDLEKQPGKNPSYYFRLFRLLRRIRPDIMHTRNIGTIDCQFVAAAAGVRHRIHGEHGWDAGDPHGKNRKHIYLRKASNSVVGRYVTVSRDLRKWLENVIGIPEEKIYQIYNGVDTNRFMPGKERDDSNRGLVIGTVGRLDPIKDQVTLLQAFAALLQRLPEAQVSPQLVIVGEGSARGILEKYAARNGITGYVKFVGASDDVSGLLRTFDVFVLPSLNEGISNTILEAMASGLPVLATNVGGNPELVDDGVTGSLFAPGDWNGLAALLQTSVEDRSLRLAQGNAGRERATNKFSMNAMTNSYLNIYDLEAGHTSAGHE